MGLTVLPSISPFPLTTGCLWFFLHDSLQIRTSRDARALSCLQQDCLRGPEWVSSSQKLTTGCQTLAKALTCYFHHHHKSTTTSSRRSQHYIIHKICTYVCVRVYMHVRSSVRAECVYSIVRVNVCACLHVCVCVYARVYMYMWLCVPASVSKRTTLCVYAYSYAYACVSRHTCASSSLHLCTYASTLTAA